MVLVRIEPNYMFARIDFNATHVEFTCEDCRLGYRFSCFGRRVTVFSFADDAVASGIISARQVRHLKFLSRPDVRAFISAVAAELGRGSKASAARRLAAAGLYVESKAKFNIKFEHPSNWLADNSKSAQNIVKLALAFGGADESIVHDGEKLLAEPRDPKESPEPIHTIDY